MPENIGYKESNRHPIATSRLSPPNMDHMTVLTTESVHGNTKKRQKFRFKF